MWRPYRGLRDTQQRTELMLPHIIDQALIIQSLITFGKIGVEIIFAIEFQPFGYFTIEGNVNPDTMQEGLPVQNRKRAGIS